MEPRAQPHVAAHAPADPHPRGRGGPAPRLPAHPARDHRQPARGAGGGPRHAHGAHPAAHHRADLPWLDRYEAEPVGYLVAAFLWGALIAVVGAFFLNSLGLALLVESHWSDPFETGAVYLAPITEETLKGLGIFLIYLLRRHEFDGIIDGIVYAGMIGAGFAFSENILYLGQAYTEMGNEGLTATFIVRGLMGPFGHPLFTSLIGIGIGIAVTTRSRGVKALAIVGGWVCAVLLHGAWNLAAIAGIEGFLTAYITFQVPLFAFIGFLVWLRRREGRLIGQYLSAYADAGWLTHAEVGMLSHVSTRRAARAWARSVVASRRNGPWTRSKTARATWRCCARGSSAALPSAMRRNAKWFCCRRSRRTGKTSSGHRCSDAGDSLGRQSWRAHPIAPPAGLEPATKRLEGSCSIR